MTLLSTKQDGVWQEIAVGIPWASNQPRQKPFLPLASKPNIFDEIEYIIMKNNLMETLRKNTGKKKKMKRENHSGTTIILDKRLDLGGKQGGLHFSSDFLIPTYWYFMQPYEHEYRL